MVRVIFVRHAESQQNAYMETLFSKVGKGNIDIKKFNKMMRDAPEGINAGADSCLTEKGKSQSKQLAEVWSTLLMEKAKSGKLLTFVSPFLRTLQTADPLMTMLTNQIPGYKAVLLPAIMENGGLCHAEDFLHFDNIEALIKKGKRKEAIKILKNVKWKPQGLTGNQIMQQFPWARTANSQDLTIIGNELNSSLGNLNKPWWNFGYETRKRSHSRISAVANWIHDALRNNVSGFTGDDVCVLMISHGEAIAEISNLLAQLAFTGGQRKEKNVHFSLEGIRNTSVTVFLLPSSSHSYVGTQPDVHGKVVPFLCKIEFFNDTTHLGRKQLDIFAKQFLSAKL